VIRPDGAFDKLGTGNLHRCICSLFLNTGSISYIKQVSP
jgi:hypothetical protein